MSVGEKAIPVPTELDAPYWQGAREHRLMLQRCSECRLLSAQPRVICPRCHGSEFEWSEVSGNGTLHSYTIVWQTTVAGFEDELPYVGSHVKIDEEATCYLTANLLVAESDYDSLTIDLPVVVAFEDRGDVTVPQFRLA